MKYFNKEWYNNGCRTLEKHKEYTDYQHRCLPEWYNEFSIHDDQIKSAVQGENYLIMNLAADDYKHTLYQLKFHNPDIVEQCELINAWCLADELYISDNLCEYHLMVSNFEDNDIIEYFTVKCSNIELIINGRSFKVFNNLEFGSIWEGVYPDEDEFE